MQTQRSHYLGTLILGVTAALASCLLALVLAALPAQANHLPVDLSVYQTDSPDPLESGYLTYTLTVKHELAQGCSGDDCFDRSSAIKVTDALPSGVTLMDLNHPRLTPEGEYSVSCDGTTTVTCTIGSLFDGESIDIDIVVRPTTAGAQSLTNIATVSHMYGDPDPDASNNSATASTQVGESYTPPSGCASMAECPNTTLTQAPETFSSVVSPGFSFTSSEANSTFECKMDGAAFEACLSPKKYFVLSEGKHTFQVRAKDVSGAVDPVPATRTWTVDSLKPKIAFTQRPGTATGPGRYDEWVTNDRTPTWAWTVRDANPDFAQDECYLYDDTNDRDILDYFPCASSSPYTFGGDLPDGDYSFGISTEDKADNYGYATNYFEVDTVAPKFVSGKPTGRSVSQYADVVATFDDNVYGSTRFLKIYKRGSTTPLAVSREYEWEDGYKYIDIDPKNWLRRDTWYTVKVGRGVTDGANNLETPTTWSFKTK